MFPGRQASRGDAYWEVVVNTTTYVSVNKGSLL